MKTFILLIAFLLGTLVAQAQAGACLNFDGINDKVNTNAINTALATKNRITVEAWINPTAFTAYGVVIGNYNTGSTNMQFMLRQEGSVIGFWVNVGFGFQVVGSGSGALTLNTWQHIAGVWDGSNLKIYINGVLKGTTLAVTGTSFVSTPNQVIMGGHNNGELFRGSIDEVRIWTRDLCLGEIINNMNGEIATTGTNLLANYHFNHGTSGGANAGVTTLIDASGNNYNGSLVGFALSGATSNWLAPGAVTSGSTVSAYTAVSATTTQTNLVCFGGNNGVANVLANGGSGAYTYLWSPGGATTASATGLSASTYTCAIADVYGCSVNKSVTLTQPTALLVNTTKTLILCHGGTSTITVTASGGTAPYTGTGTFVVAAGTYSYTVVDNNGCSTTANITVTEPAVLNANSSATTIACNGETTDVTITATGGTVPYTGNGIVTELAGTYNYTVTDNNGCTATTNISITEPAPLIANSSATTIACNGETADVTITATGGTIPYTGNGIVNELVGTYNYTVTDNNGCTATTNISITEPTVLTASSSATTIACNGETADVTITASGGTIPYTGTGIVTELAGTYNYTVTDNNGCTATTNISITEPAALIANSSATTIACNGESADVTINATGGTLPYIGNGIVTELAGTYNYTVTDNNGCTATTNISITEPTVLMASSSATTIACNGESADVTITATGGTLPYTGTGIVTELAGTYNYTVTDTNGCTATTNISITEPASIITSQTVIVCLGDTVMVGTNSYSSTGIYQDVFTSADGCDSTVITNLTVNDGVDVSLNVSGITLMANQAGAVYQWINCATTSEIPGETNQSFTAVTNGEYAVIVTIGTCSDTSTCSSVTTIGVDELNTIASKVYPNPSNGLFTVELAGDSQIEITDVLGKVIFTQHLEQGKHAIDVSNEQNGVYLLSIHSNGIINKMRIVKD